MEEFESEVNRLIQQAGKKVFQKSYRMRKKELIEESPDLCLMPFSIPRLFSFS
jgi:hypothetical protein